MKKVLGLIFILLLTILVIGCNNDDDNDNATNTSLDFEDLVINDDFKFRTEENIVVEITIQNANGEGVANVPFVIYTANPDEGGEFISKGATDTDGLMQLNVAVATMHETLFLVGYMSSFELPIVNNLVSYTFGEGADDAARNSKIAVKNRYTKMGFVLDYNSSGTPIGMESDYLEPGFLSKVNATLPENRPIPQYHGAYLDPENELNVVLIEEQAEVWVTFVHEGAGHLNTLAYYTYQAGDEPQTIADVDSVTVIFPNVSMVNSGGGLLPGDKIFLGEFSPGTVIGWMLVDRGWDGNNQTIFERDNTWYSNYNINYNGNQQSILVYDDEYEKLLFGFEDLVFSYGDDDFNDAIFYATVNPINAVNLENVKPIDDGADTDGDGISDIFDDFPQDPERAFCTDNDTQSTLAFEDLWPTKGDYDFNDMVLDYNMFYHLNANNKVKNIICEFELKAVGARYQNGFGIEFPFDASLIESITIIDGSDPLTMSDVVSDVNFSPALEDDGDKAVIIFINNTNDLIQQSSENFINTQLGVPYVEPAVFALDIKLSTAQQTTNWEWIPPYNPFIFVDRDRTHEIHLLDFPPTSRADISLFGVDHDDSNIGSNQYYKTINNLPWALNIVGSWDYPIEYEQASRAYLKLKPWAESSGASYQDWYEDKAGYRDESIIYSH